MGLAGPDAADEDDVALMSQEIAAGEIMNERLVDRRAIEGEFGDVLSERQLGDFGVSGTDVEATVTFFEKLLTACGQQFELEEIEGAFLLHAYSFLPFDSDAPDQLKIALFEFQTMAARLMSGRVSVQRQSFGRSETWKLADGSGSCQSLNGIKITSLFQLHKCS